ncbi:hypothetical protein B296_00036219, partial [Ensete ventricosum]
IATSWSVLGAHVFPTCRPPPSEGTGDGNAASRHVRDFEHFASPLELTAETWR